MSIDDKIVKLISNNSFYQSLYNGIEDITLDKLPIINKAVVLSNYDKICTDKHNTLSISTSGTTGQPLVVRWSERDYIYSNLYTWKLRKKWYDITPADKFCTFHVDTERGLAEMSILNDGRTLSLGKYCYSGEVINRYVNAMKEFEPRWILGPASLVYILFKKMREKKIVISSLKYVELNGEYVSVEMYREIMSLSNVKVGNLYGSTEFNGIAFLCPYGNMHILNQNVYVENEHRGQNSNIIITGLSNTIMPLIRYDIGDLGLVKDDVQCPCGQYSKVLEITYGRNSEVITNNDDDSINSSAFSTLVYRLNRENNVVIQYCVDIRETGYVLQLLVTEAAYNSVKRQIPWMKRELQRFGIVFEIELYTQMEDIIDGSGKFVFVKKHGV